MPDTHLPAWPPSNPLSFIALGRRLELSGRRFPRPPARSPDHPFSRVPRHGLQHRSLHQPHLSALHDFGCNFSKCVCHALRHALCNLSLYGFSYAFGCDLFHKLRNIVGNFLRNSARHLFRNPLRNSGANKPGPERQGVWRQRHSGSGLWPGRRLHSGG